MDELTGQLKKMASARRQSDQSNRHLQVTYLLGCVLRLCEMIATHLWSIALSLDIRVLAACQGQEPEVLIVAAETDKQPAAGPG